VSAPFELDDLLHWTGGRLRQGRRPPRFFSGVSIDTRTLRAGELFVAIRGEKHDAHDFLAGALAGGAAGLVVEIGRSADADLREPLPVVEVADTTRALGALAAGHRARFEGPMVAITGSSGKTTTKEMCASILSQAGPCLKTEGNLNNEFGLPLTLLRREREHCSAVVELGMNHRGEIARLAAIAKPTVALVTNVGTAHIEFLGSREEIAREKGDLFAGLGPGGVAVVNRDDPLVTAEAARARGKLFGYGRLTAAEVSARNVRFVEDGAPHFELELETPQGSRALRVNGLGETHVINALAAAAAAMAAGADLDAVAAGLEACRPIGGRMAQRKLAGDINLIDDSYNANPQSMRAALETLARLGGRSQTAAVLGDMAELGESAPEAHRDIGRLAAELHIDFLFALGERAETLAAGAIAAGMDPTRVTAGCEHEDASRHLREVLRRDDWVLVKGSRAMKMERVVEALCAEEPS
jgi:UDP-N-acetylmuramoyl-tripeptide--D-alanyl-D-alanine ligase